jgi:alcohol dehydrogenase
MLQKEFLGKGSLKNIKDIINELDAKKILLVTGKKSFTSSGAASNLNAFLKNKDVAKFNDFEANPKLEDVYSGVELIRQEKPDLIIAIGGGSVIDMAKLINILAAQTEQDALNVINDSSLIHNKGQPLVAIPTTSGTGTQATHFAVVYIDKVKYSLPHKYILPDYAVVDFSLSYGTPKEIAACSGMDALSQAVESYWSINATNESKKYSSEAIRTILPAISLAINNKDRRAIRSMSIAAHLAGKAINLTKTTAAHAISYPITTYFNVPHGHAVALTLGEFFLINSDIKYNSLIDKRGDKYNKSTMAELYEMFECADAQTCCDKWYDLMDQIGLERNLNTLGICNMADIKLIIKNVNLERLYNNPVKVNDEILFRMFNKAINLKSNIGSKI